MYVWKGAGNKSSRLKQINKEDVEIATLELYLLKVCSGHPNKQAEQILVQI
jgi:hypothetical protein